MRWLSIVWMAGAVAGCRQKEPATPTVETGCAGTSADVHIEGGTLSLQRDGCGVLSLGEARVLGDGTFAVSWQQQGELLAPVLTATSDGAVFRALHLTGTVELAGEPPARLWRQGYHSWSASGVFDLVPVELDGDGLPALGGDAGGFDVVFEKPGTSWWAGLVGREWGASALIGAVAARRTKFAIAADGDPEHVGAVHVVWGGRGEAIAVPNGAAITLDPIRLSLGDDPNTLWRDWADSVAAFEGITLPAPPPLGWSTWYQYYEDVSEDDVRSNLAKAAALNNDPDNTRIGLFQIDDGWEIAWGDWTANERFPSGMAALAADIAAEGMIPGLWMAPLYVSRETDTYRDHPDWFVHGLDGSELEYQGNVALDVTHPDAAAWLRGVIASKVAEGWTYLKLDFLYAGAEEGTRHLDVTGIEAYRIALDLMREAAGDSTWILACGAPLLPSAGFAQSYRTGPDIAFTLDPDPRRPYLRNQVRSTAARGFTNGRLWWIDADALMMRPPFSEDDARGSVVSMALSGGAWLLGDDMVALDPQRLSWALHPGATASIGLDVVPVSPLQYASGWDTTPLIELTQNDDRVPITWQLSDGTTALLNLSDAPLTVEGPGGTELLTGEWAESGPRTLPPGVGELWR